MGIATGVSSAFVMGAVGLLALGVPPQSPPPLPPSTLPVQVLAVAVDTESPAKSSCLIRCAYPEQTRSASLLRPGQTACDVAEITEILKDAVVIRNLLTNRLERLAFGKTEPALSAEAAKDTPAAAAAPVVAASSDVVTVQLQKDSVSRYLANLPDFLNSALAIPRYRDNGKGQTVIDGFEINRIKEGSVVEQLGLQNGDVILEVNGDTLNGMDAVVRLVGQVQGMTQVKMIVLRNGRRMTFVFNTK